MKAFIWISELGSALITCVAFAMGFNSVHNALMYLQTGNDLDEAERLIEQAHTMFSVAAVCGVIFLVLFSLKAFKRLGKATETAIKDAEAYS
ncbi:hypothetical protein C5L39_03385 [Corynebacterium alimapuense]|uniref:Uncharacterized protein n=1 Tax=Corynebacterium alimapuense TaxID=1576874 RepID=A0A3M8K962_9CORY|nr:hypothetical protein C5L39_03385 [Corynebacterium alimapuense]